MTSVTKVYQSIFIITRLRITQKTEGACVPKVVATHIRKIQYTKHAVVRILHIAFREFRNATMPRIIEL